MQRLTPIAPIALALALVLVLVGLTACQTGGENVQERLQASQPDPSLSPEEVVRVQLEALRNNGPEDQGIAIAYRFASPQNKQNTGPLPRFTRMLKSDAYRPMLDAARLEFRDTRTREPLARVVVEITTGGGQTVTYAFFLRRQSVPDCTGCWLTEGVEILEQSSFGSQTV
jgi:hypothetical protein